MSEPTSPPIPTGPTGPTRRAGWAGPLGAIVFVAAGIAGFLAESSARTSGFDDADNPAESLALFAVNPTAYSVSGLALSVGALGLLVLVFAVSETVLVDVRPLYGRCVTAFGTIAAGLFFLGGVIRLQAPGTVSYIAALDRDWGLAAYLAVQMSGTQGALSAAIYAVAIWAVSLCAVAARAGRLPVPVLVLGGLPALVLLVPLAALFARLIGQASLDVLFPVYLLAVFGGIPLFTLGLGVVLWRRRGWTVA